MRKAKVSTATEYIALVPKSSRKAFLELRATIRAAVPRDAKEVISYGILALKRGRILVWYAAFANHCSLYPSAAIIRDFKKKLKGLSISTGTIQFPIDKPLPKALIKEVVKARVAAAEGAARKKSS